MYNLSKCQKWIQSHCCKLLLLEFVRSVLMTLTVSIFKLIICATVPLLCLNTYLYLILEVGLHRRMSFNCPTRYIDPAGFWTYCVNGCGIENFIWQLVPRCDDALAEECCSSNCSTSLYSNFVLVTSQTVCFVATFKKFLFVIILKV